MRVITKPYRESLAFIAAVLLVSAAYTGFVFSSPERMNLFVFVMLIPGTIALIFSISTRKSARQIVAPFRFGTSRFAYLFSMFYPLVFIGTCALVALSLSLGTFDTEKLKNLAPGFRFFNTVIGVLLILGEEYAWRGYLLPLLERAGGRKFAAVGVGIVWAIWHAPVVYGLASATGVGNPLAVMLVQMGAVFCFSFPFAYVAFLSGSILPPMIFHWVWNLYNPIVLGNLYRNQAGIIVGDILTINGEGILVVILGLAFIVWFFVRYGAVKKDLSKVLSGLGT